MFPNLDVRHRNSLSNPSGIDLLSDILGAEVDELGDRDRVDGLYFGGVEQNFHQRRGRYMSFCNGRKSFEVGFMWSPLPLVATSLLDGFGPIPGACESIFVGGCTSGDSIHQASSVEGWLQPFRMRCR